MAGDVARSAARRIIVAAGSNRVADDAADALGVIMEQVGLEVAKQAVFYARYAVRKTVTPKDIEAAAKQTLPRLGFFKS